MIKQVWWALALFFLTSGAFAQDGLSIRVSSDFLEREMTAALKEQLGSKFKKLSISRKDANTSRITASFKGFSIFGAKATIDFGFSCWWRDPDVRVIYKSHNFSITPLPDFLTQIFTSGFIDREFVTSYTRAIQAKLPDVFTDCPQFQVESNGDITMNWQQGSQCSDGATKHAACSYGQWGDGTDHICVNGYWEIDRRECESCADSSHPSCPRRQPGGGGNGRLPNDL